MSARDDLVRAMEARRLHLSDIDNAPNRDAYRDSCEWLMDRHGPALLALLDAEPVAWIPVSERLPDENEFVVCVDMLLDVPVAFCAYRVDDESIPWAWFDRSGEAVAGHRAVTHWLPAPPGGQR